MCQECPATPVAHGHVPSHLPCLGMLGHASQAQLDAARCLPPRTPVVSENQRGPSSFPQHARGSAHSADCFSSRSVQLGTVKCCLSPSEPALHMISSEPGYKPLE